MAPRMKGLLHDTTCVRNAFTDIIVPHEDDIYELVSNLKYKRMYSSYQHHAVEGLGKIETFLTVFFLPLFQDCSFHGMRVFSSEQRLKAYYALKHSVGVLSRVHNHSQITTDYSDLTCRLNSTILPFLEHTVSPLQLGYSSLACH